MCICIYISCYTVPRAEEFRGSVTIEKFKKQRFEICNKRAIEFECSKSRDKKL